MKQTKLISAVALVFGVVALVNSSASAHVVVQPGEVLTSARQTFSVSVPNEHDTSVVGVRLVVPEGVTSVRPYAKAGWDVKVTKTGEGEATRVSEITWTGGAIPVDLKDDFQFGAKAPADATELQWKAYETYADGMVVSWDQAGESEEEGSTSGPYSITKVIAVSEKDAAHAADTQSIKDNAKTTKETANRAQALGVIGIVLGFIALGTRGRQKR